MRNDEDWTVWSDRTEPELTGSETDCKAFVVSHSPDRLDLYVAAPNGTEWEYYDGKWRQT